MHKILFYTKANCSLCDDAMTMLHMLQYDYQFAVEERDIESREDWHRDYKRLIPVVEVSGKQLDCESIGYEQLKQLFEGVIPKR